MRQIPGSMHQPSDPDQPVRSEGEIDHRYCDHGVDQLPNPKPAVQVSAAGSGHQYGVESSTHRFRNARHDEHKTECPNRGAIKVSSRKHLQARHLIHPPGHQPTDCITIEPVAKRQRSQDLRQIAGHPERGAMLLLYWLLTAWY